METFSEERPPETNVFDARIPDGSGTERNNSREKARAGDLVPMGDRRVKGSDQARDGREESDWPDRSSEEDAQHD